MYKINILLKQESKLFHTQDLAILWGIENLNTLYTTVKRYIKKGVLIKVQKGLYSTVPLEKLEPTRLGLSFLHTYAYLSTESVLTRAGIIFQVSSYITFISSLARKFNLGTCSYLVRQMKDEFLYQTAGLEENNGIKTATVERAVADLLYFDPFYHFDNRQAINWQEVKRIQKEVGFK